MSSINDSDAKYTSDIVCQHTFHLPHQSTSTLESNLYDIIMPQVDTTQPNEITYVHNYINTITQINRDLLDKDNNEDWKMIIYKDIFTNNIIINFNRVE
jgi:hypothetical protein